MDPGRLDDLVNRIRSRQIAELNGLVVVRNGYVVLEEYANGSSATDVHTMQSVTKSIASLLVGIAIDQGKIPGVASRALGFFPEYADIANMDDRKRAVTLASLLTMRSGINFFEIPYQGSTLEQLNNSQGDWLRIVFNQPMNAAPNELWQYNSGGVITLGGILYNTTGMAADEFARRNLFEPIGISVASWYKGNPNGLPHLGGGLSLRARDLARIGYLVLRKGKWGDRQVVSESWIRESTLHHARPAYTVGRHPAQYGYLWWILPVDDKSSNGWDTDVITATGSKGQWLFVIPKYDLVVAATSNGAGYQGYIDPVDFLYTHILPAIRE